eukprot:GHVU01120176.1.p1 GENE.GHVU01120176.1~~GHVU01120176.1.p1  ORF type:complete len:249 (+),score=2.16 GHVU01120176.1:291-1037(+)
MEAGNLFSIFWDLRPPLFLEQLCANTVLQQPRRSCIPWKVCGLLVDANDYWGAYAAFVVHIRKRTFLRKQLGECHDVHLGSSQSVYEDEYSVLHRQSSLPALGSGPPRSAHGMEPHRAYPRHPYRTHLLLLRGNIPPNANVKRDSNFRHAEIAVRALPNSSVVNFRSLLMLRYLTCVPERRRTVETQILHIICAPFVTVSSLTTSLHARGMDPASITISSFHTWVFEIIHGFLDRLFDSIRASPQTHQ